MAPSARESSPKPLTSQQALKALREALFFSKVREGRHIREKMAEREFDMNDIVHLAQRGAVKRPPEHDIKRRTWEYMVEGKDVDGLDLEIVFAVDRGGRVTLITGRRP